MTAAIVIGDRPIGPGNPTYVVAELSANHNKDLDRAVAMVRAAAGAGADAVKIQTYTPETMTLDAEQPWFRVGEGTVWTGRSLYDLYEEACTPWEWHARLHEVAEECGVAFFSTPFDGTAADYLDQMDVPVFKIASFEIVDIPLIEMVASKRRPMIISTGMATVGEIDAAVRAAVRGGAGGVALLRCNSSYPAPAREMDLATLPHMAAMWHVPVGLSDHTLGISAAVASVALGASIVEKHLTLSRASGGPDSAFSCEPDEFCALVAAVREAEQVVGSVRYGPTEHERASLAFRRSLFVVRDVRAGEPLTEENVRSIRPANGLSPSALSLVLGRHATRDVERGTPLSWDLVSRP